MHALIFHDWFIIFDRPVHQESFPLTELRLRPTTALQLSRGTPSTCGGKDSWYDMITSKCIIFNNACFSDSCSNNKVNVIMIIDTHKK